MAVPSTRVISARSDEDDVFFRLVLAMRLAVEEKGLANDGLQTFGFEGFGYEKGGFRRRPRQETLRIGRDEYHRYEKRFKNLIDRVETRASVGKLNIREDEAWRFAPDGVDRLAMSPRDIGDAVPCSSTRF